MFLLDKSHRALGNLLYIDLCHKKIRINNQNVNQSTIQQQSNNNQTNNKKTTKQPQNNHKKLPGEQYLQPYEIASNRS
jgi:hypothetical protein